MPWVAAEDVQQERHDIQLFGGQQPDGNVSDRSVQSSENSAQGPPPLPRSGRDATVAVAANVGSARTDAVDLCPQLVASGKEGANFRPGIHVVRPGAARYVGAFHLKLDDEALEAVRRQLTTGALPAEGAGLSPRPAASILTSTGVRLSDFAPSTEWDGSVADEKDASRLIHSPPHSGFGGSSEALGSFETPREGNVARECSTTSVSGKGWRGAGLRGPPLRAGSQRPRLEPVSLPSPSPLTSAHTSKPSKPSKALLCATEVIGNSPVKGPQTLHGPACKPAVANSRLRCPNLCLWRRGNASRAAGSVGGANGGSDAVRSVAASLHDEAKPLDLQSRHCWDSQFSELPVSVLPVAVDKHGHRL